MVTETNKDFLFSFEEDLNVQWTTFENIRIIKEWDFQKMLASVILAFPIEWREEVSNFVQTRMEGLEKVEDSEKWKRLKLVVSEFLAKNKKAKSCFIEILNRKWNSTESIH